MPSSAAYAGGDDGGVHCANADCATGADYCYATSDGKCANCHLFGCAPNVVHDTPLCDAAAGRVPQGGAPTDYSAAEWSANGLAVSCASPSQGQCAWPNLFATMGEPPAQYCHVTRAHA